MENGENGNPRDLYASIQQRAEQGIEARNSEISRLEAELADHKVQIKQLSQISGTANATVLSLDRGNVAQAVRRLDAAKDFADNVRKFNADSAEGIQPSIAELRERARAQVLALAETLPPALPVGYEADVGSRFPKFTFRAAFLTVEIVAKKLEAVVQTRGTKRFRIDADVEVIVEHVRRELDRCFNRNADLQEFGTRLRAAYNTVRETTGLPAVRLSDVLAAFEGDPPPRDEFAVDLAALIQLPRDQAPPGVSGMKLDHTRDTDTGFLLPGSETIGYFGSISFDDTQAGQ